MIIDYKSRPKNYTNSIIVIIALIEVIAAILIAIYQGL